jgi:hypothetical protein
MLPVPDPLNLDLDLEESVYLLKKHAHSEVEIITF